MTRDEKLQTFVLYMNTECVCGNKKKANRWLCIPCRNKVSIMPEWIELDKACETHVIHANKILDLCRIK